MDAGTRRALRLSLRISRGQTRGRGRRFDFLFGFHTDGRGDAGASALSSDFTRIDAGARKGLRLLLLGFHADRRGDAAGASAPSIRTSRGRTRGRGRFDFLFGFHADRRGDAAGISALSSDFARTDAGTRALRLSLRNSRGLTRGRGGRFGTLFGFSRGPTRGRGRFGCLSDFTRADAGTRQAFRLYLRISRGPTRGRGRFGSLFGFHADRRGTRALRLLLFGSHADRRGDAGASAFSSDLTRTDAGTRQALRLSLRI